jgi:APA family basic amino acid/polyamine antiporter
VAVVGLAAVNYRGVTKTAALTKALVAGTLAALAVGVVAILTGPRDGGLEVAADAGSAGWYGVLQSAGLLFFAFAGYARIATMGEEVTEPERTIPRAVTLALATTVAVYGIVALAVLSAVGASELADSSAPVLAAVEASAGEAAGVVLRAGAVVATLGALLSLVAGVGRTSLAMARGGDLPSWLGAVHPRYHVPHHAEVALAAVVCLLVLTVDLRGAIGFSSFGVLVYYAIANASAFTQPAAVRRWPRAVFVLGLAGCVVLVATLPLASVAAGLAVFAVGLSGRWLLQRGRAGRPRSPG